VVKQGHLWPQQVCLPVVEVALPQRQPRFSDLRPSSCWKEECGQCNNFENIFWQKLQQSFLNQIAARKTSNLHETVFLLERKKKKSECGRCNDFENIFAKMATY
jgi:hypothetical protein